MKTISAISIVVTAFVFMAGSAGLCELGPDWAPVTGNEDNMVAYGHVFLGAVDFATGNYELYSFGPGGETDCRSRSEIKPDGLYYATIVGNIDGEALSFKVLGTTTGMIYELQDTITFQKDETKKDLDIH